jgi:hypothetical protein
VNSTASKEGWIYMMGGLVNSQMVKGDLWMVEVGNGSMNCFPVNTTSEGPGPRVGHASLLVGNAFIVFGGDTKLEDGDLLDDTLYLLNTGTCFHILEGTMLIPHSDEAMVSSLTRWATAGRSLRAHAQHTWFENIYFWRSG